MACILLGVGRAEAQNRVGELPGGLRHETAEAPAASLQELLEFLGQWETHDGNWMDPGDLDWLIESDPDEKKDERE